MKKNDVIQISITAMSHEGEGIGRHEGMAVFVPMSAIGDELRVKIVRTLSNRAYGIIEEILKPAEARIENDCPHYRVCGGCDLRHITTESELEIKANMSVENMRRIGGIELEWEAPIDSPQHSRYRNKAALPVGLRDRKIVSGFFAKRSHRLIAMEDCLLQPEFFGDITRCVCEFCEQYNIAPYDEQAHKGVLRHIVIRHAAKTGEVMVSLVVKGKKLPYSAELVEKLLGVCPAIKTIVLDFNNAKTNVIGGTKQTVLYGTGSITDELCGVHLGISTGSFYQINRDAAELLYKQALEYAAPQPDDVLLDLYCGTGSIGLSMAGHVKELIGVEIVPAAVEDAERNAAENGISARFLCMDAGKAAEVLHREGLKPDIVLLDPPRRGIDAETVEHVSAMQPQRIVYISCNSATLARDCAMLLEKGYEVKRGRVVNLFARTSHVETVVLLEKSEK